MLDQLEDVLDFLFSTESLLIYFLPYIISYASLPAIPLLRRWLCSSRSKYLWMTGEHRKLGTYLVLSDNPLSSQKSRAVYYCYTKFIKPASPVSAPPNFIREWISRKISGDLILQTAVFCLNYFSIKNQFEAQKRFAMTKLVEIRALLRSNAVCLRIVINTLYTACKSIYACIMDYS